MADNTTLNSGSGGDTIATDDIAGVKFQRVKIVIGADGTNDGDVSSSNAMPVSGTVSLSDSYSVALSGPVSLSDSYSVVISSGSVTVSGAVSLTGSSSVLVSGTVSLSDSYSVVISAALPAGTNAIGKLAANSGVDIGDVDVTSVVPGTGATNLGKAVDSAAGGTDTGIAPLAIRDDALTTLTPIDGDYTPLRVDSTGALWVQQAGTVSLTGSSSVVITSGSVTVSGAVSLTGSMSVVIADGAVVSLSDSYSVVISSNVTVVGGAAHDAAVSGNPLLTGLEARTTNPTAVGDGDAVRAMADDVGRQVVTMFAPRDLVTEAHLTSLSATTTQSLLAAGGAGVFHDITHLALSNFSASVANVVILDGVTGGTERWKFDLAADGGGAVMNFSTPFRQSSANAVWAVRCADTTDIAVTIQAVKNV